MSRIRISFSYREDGISPFYFLIFSLKSIVFYFRVLQDTVFLDKKFSINESSIKSRGRWRSENQIMTNYNQRWLLIILISLKRFSTLTLKWPNKSRIIKKSLLTMTRDNDRKCTSWKFTPKKVPIRGHHKINAKNTFFFGREF